MTNQDLFDAYTYSMDSLYLRLIDPNIILKGNYEMANGYRTMTSIIDEVMSQHRQNTDYTVHFKNGHGIFCSYADGAIKQIIFNDPATIILWRDGTKTVVKCKNEPFDPEKGMAMAIAKKAFGNKGNYYNVFTKWLPKEEEVEGVSNPIEALKRAIEKLNNSEDIKK